MKLADNKYKEEEVKSTNGPNANLPQSEEEWTVIWHKIINAILIISSFCILYGSR